MNIIAKNSISRSEIPVVIKEKRLRLNMTQKELADAVGMSKNGDRTIRRWESGETCPSPLEISAIMNFPEKAPFKNLKTAKYTMIDLFAGIGGTRLGFHQTQKVKSVFSSEIDKFAVKTYKANYGEEPFGDITEIDANRLSETSSIVPICGADTSCTQFVHSTTSYFSKSEYPPNFNISSADLIAVSTFSSVISTCVEFA